MEIEIQNHIAHLGKFSVKKSENDCLLDEACTMASTILNVGCEAPKLLVMVVEEDGRISICGFRFDDLVTSRWDCGGGVKFLK